MHQESYKEQMDSRPEADRELIRKYLGDALSPEEERRLAGRYESDRSFREALDGFEGMTPEEFDASMARLSGRIQARVSQGAPEERAAEAHTPARSPGRTYQMYSFRRLAIAASAAILLLVAGGIAINQVKSPADRLVAAHFAAKPYPDQITRGEGVELSQMERLAIASYNSEDYAVSVDHFSALYAQHPENVKYGLFLAISQMGVSDYTRAVETLTALRSGDHVYTEDVLWYLGLSYLKLKRPEEAVAVFSTLAGNERSFYSDGARQILDKLN